MRRVSITVLALLAAMLMGACSDPFVIADLGGKTFTFYSGIDGGGFNGHDTTTLVFNEAGDGGTYEGLEYIFDYPTAEAETAALVAGKAWFQNGGTRGTFAFNEDTNVITMDVMDVYGLKAGASTDFRSDYEWKTLLQSLRDGMLPEATIASQSISMTVAINQDKLVQAFFEDGDDFFAIMSTTYSFGTDAASMTVRENASTTWTIGPASIAETRRTNSHIVTDNGGTTDIDDEVHQTVSTYRVEKVFEIGGAGTEFAEIWKAGKAVTFALTRTEYVEIVDDTADAAPTIPEIDQATGIGVNDPDGGGPEDGVGDYYAFDRNQYATEISFAREKEFIMFCDDRINAYRNME